MNDLLSGSALSQAVKDRGISVRSRRTKMGKRYAAYGRDGILRIWYERLYFSAKKNTYEIILQNLLRRRYEQAAAITEDRAIQVTIVLEEYPKDNASGVMWEVKRGNKGIWNAILNGVQLTFNTGDPLVISLVKDQAWLHLWDYLQD